MHPDSLDAVDVVSHSLAETLTSGDRGIEWLEELLCLDQAVRELDPRDRELLYRRLFLEETHAELGERMGMTQMQVSRQLAKIQAGLQGRLRDDVLQSSPSCRTAPRAS